MSAETTDRELLELAAKAAGLSMKRHGPSSDGRRAALDNGLFWAPFDDDGDALRLAVSVGMNLCLTSGLISAEYLQGRKKREVGYEDPYAATRRAIVRAAAEIGRAMK